MSRHFFERLEPGYAGEKYSTYVKCKLPWCNEWSSFYKGVGQNYCENHQKMLREYGGPARTDRPWTFNKKRACDFCEKNPWEHPKVKEIGDDLIRDRVAWGMLIVDHIHTQRDGGSDHPNNCQTLCLDCNQIKSTLACDTMPRSLYNTEEEYESVKDRLKPWLDKLFG
jgi:5-methylcytosine-specific restriction endonuclease McrA